MDRRWPKVRELGVGRIGVSDRREVVREGIEPHVPGESKRYPEKWMH